VAHIDSLSLKWFFVDDAQIAKPAGAAVFIFHHSSKKPPRRRGAAGIKGMVSHHEGKSVAR
jgi:hypothetical protein